MRFASLGSGSDGNALLVESNGTRVLLDCGFGINDLTARLARLGLAPDMLDAVIVTHEHEDHAGGVARLARRSRAVVHLTHGTLQALPAAERDVLAGAVIIDSHTRFTVGDIGIEPFPVPHDAREPVQFVFHAGGYRLGVLTDVGCSTPHIEATLSGVDALVLECNHDADMLSGGRYPPSLKHRIAGRMGHLDNSTAARIVSAIDCSRLQHFIAAHLSRENNTAELVQAAMAQALNTTPDWIGIATQDDGFDWRELG